MNYFELYGLPVSFQVDQDDLKNKFYILSRKYHPEHDPDAGKGSKDIMEMSTHVIRGYNILQDQDEIIKYVLHLKGLVKEGEVYEPSPQFQLEVMDINEELMELELDEGREQLMNVEQKANRLLFKLYEDVIPVIDNYQEDTATEETMLQIRDFYLQKKYVLAILDRINGIRNIASRS